jgi:2'-5' RNA ligase
VSYLVSIPEYEERFSDRLIAPPNPMSAPNKFAPDGSREPFYGLTCIAWIDQKSELFPELRSLQKEIERSLQWAGLGDFFAFLRPESFHMTICDINASPDSSRCFDGKIIETVQEAFKRIKTSEKVIAQIRGIGLKTTITALVHFNAEHELHDVLRMEHEIKEAIHSLDSKTKNSTCVRVRDFAGHISLAYCVQDPGKEDAERIRETLRSYEDQDLGEFNFTQFDLAYFTDMNTYIPVLTVNLNDNTITSHTGNIEMLEKTTELFKAARSLLETWAADCNFVVADRCTKSGIWDD